MELSQIQAGIKRKMDKENYKDQRPWGYFIVLADESDHKVKRIVIFPKARLSLQKHKLRTEHWFIVSGRAIVTKDTELLELEPGSCVDIPRNAAHRIENPGPGLLTFIEVQSGDYFGEDDIERLHDDYGRT